MPMTTLLVYILKVIILSGLLLGYYRLWLRDRSFHRFNRWYLLAAIPASLLLPLTSLPGLAVMSHHTLSNVSGALHAITPGDWQESSPRPAAPANGISLWSTALLLFYASIAGYLIYAFVRQIMYVLRLPAKYSRETKHNISFFITAEPGAPFSFLKNIFWSEQLDSETPEGRQIFEHELYHVRQKHTLDLLFVRPQLILFWFNPFFHLLYRELRTIHEFQADAHAAASGNRFQYAEMLVWQTVRQSSAILHPFFQSPIKRRITMITKFTTKAPGYASRLMVLPLLFLLLCAFAKSIHSSDPTGPKTMGMSEFTVVIDAGHGGSDAGAIAGDYKEKDLNLALALKIKELSAAYHVNVLLTRSGDELSGDKASIRESLVYRTQFAAEQRADLFVSLHTDASNSSEQRGFTIYISPDNSHYQQCRQAGSDMIESLKSTYTTAQSLRERREGTWVLKSATMPSILILCGNINNSQDLAFVSNDQNREKIARNILEGIVRYQSQQAKQYNRS